MYKNPIKVETLCIVQYLHYKNIRFLPSIIIERNHTPFVTELPTINYKNKMYKGLAEVVSLYEEISGIQNILEKAMEFKNLNPKYTINK